VELSPSGLLEGTLSYALAHDAFKVNRLREIEMARIMRAASKGLDTKEIARRLKFPWEQTNDELFSQPPKDFELQRAVQQAWVSLVKPPSVAVTGSRRVPSSTEDKRAAEIFDTAFDLPSHRALLKYMHADFFDRLDIVMLEDRSGVSYLACRIKEQAEGLVLVQYWLYRNTATSPNAPRSCRRRWPWRSSVMRGSCVQVRILAIS